MDSEKTRRVSGGRRVTTTIYRDRNPDSLECLEVLRFISSGYLGYKSQKQTSTGIKKFNKIISINSKYYWSHGELDLWLSRQKNK